MINRTSNSIRKFPGVAKQALQVLFFLFASFLYFLALYPFVDVYNFTHDIYFLYFSTIFLITVYRVARGVIEGKFGRFFSRYKGGFKVVLKDLLSVAVTLGTVVVFGGVLGSVIWFLNWIGLLSFLSQPFDAINAKFDPTPFDLQKYLSNILGESGLDLILIGASVLFMYLTAGKSLKPLAQFVFLGGTIVIVGWLSGLILDM